MPQDEFIGFITKTLNDMKAYDVTVLNVEKLTTMTDNMIIATGQSDRQVRALASKLLEEVKHRHHEVLGTEGIEQGQWALLDFGDVIVHVMRPDLRDYYQLEKLWSMREQDSIKTV